MSFSKPHRHREEGEEYKKFARRIFERDGYRCRNPFCGATTNLTVHHLKKRSQLGDDLPGNCITLCVRCHDDAEAHRLEIEVVDVVIKVNGGSDVRVGDSR